MQKNKHLVFSSDPVLNQKIRLDLKTKPSSEKNTSPNKPLDNIVRIHRETKGRGGKGVSLIKGIQCKEADLKILCKNLKQHCGTGGTVKDGVIEIQGDHREKLKRLLEKEGYTAKLAGS